MADLEQETELLTLQGALDARRGLVEDLDLGFRIYTLGVDLSARWRVLNGPWRVALVPTIGGLRTRDSPMLTDATHLFVQLPVPVTRELGSWGRLTFGPRALWGLYYPKTWGWEQGLMLGAFSNLELRLGESKVWLIPELSLHRSVSGQVPVDGSWAQLGLGVRWRP